MPFNIPLPNAPAGSFMEGMKQSNELTKQSIDNRINRIKAQYAPVTVPADAASKLAYANLMGPQFLAKLMGNESAVANLGQGQREKALDIAYKAGTGQGLTNPLAAILQNVQQQQNPLMRLFHSIGGMFGGGGQSSNQQQPQSQMQPQHQQQIMQQENTMNMNEDQSGQQPTFTNQSQSVPYRAPIQEPDLQPYEAPTSQERDYFKKAGQEKGKMKQEEKGGELRADTIADMGKEYAASQKLNDAYQELTDLTNNPKFQNMRKNIPFFQNLQMKALSKIGNPEQQEMIGTFKQAAQKILSNSVNSFEGRKFLGEFKTTNDMKVNDNDTFNTIVGKMQAGMLLNNFNQQRIDIASDLMQNEHKSEKDALKEADKRLDRKKIENDIKNLIKVTIVNKKTGEKKTIPIHEARELGVLNV